LGFIKAHQSTKKSVEASGGPPDIVLIYRRPILDFWCETAEDLQQIARHVLIHEIGHHFGFSDGDMETIEAGADNKTYRET
jgi:predicted Zn-dependent protease with MMP-like domain